MQNEETNSPLYSPIQESLTGHKEKVIFTIVHGVIPAFQTRKGACGMRNRDILHAITTYSTLGERSKQCKIVKLSHFAIKITEK